jgi:hypothetical protein
VGLGQLVERPGHGRGRGPAPTRREVGGGPVSPPGRDPQAGIRAR